MDALAGASRGWVERYRKRQQELAEGVDADLVQANRLRTPTTDIQQQAVTAMSLSISKYAPNPGQECEGDFTSTTMDELAGRRLFGFEFYEQFLLFTRLQTNQRRSRRIRWIA